MKRASVVLGQGQDLALNTAGKTYLLVAGNRNFSFYAKGKLAKPAKINGSIYYKISNGKITSITKDEFQSLNQSTDW